MWTKPGSKRFGKKEEVKLRSDGFDLPTCIGFLHNFNLSAFGVLFLGKGENQLKQYF